MADQPISALTQVAAPSGTPPYPTAFTSPTTGAMLEILDTTNTSMASTGTNSKIAPGDLIKGYLAAGTGMTITETSGVVTLASSGGFVNPMTTAGDLIDGGSSGTPQRLAIGTSGNVLTSASGAPTWLAPVTSVCSTVQYTSGSPTGLTTSMANMGPTITLPSAGTYLIAGTIRSNINLTAATQGGFVQISSQLYDATNSAAVPNSPAMLFLAGFQASWSSSVLFQNASPIGPVIYTVAGSAVINIQGSYFIASGTFASGDFGGNAAGYTSLTYVRIA